MRNLPLRRVVLFEASVLLMLILGFAGLPTRYDYVPVPVQELQVLSGGACYANESQSCPMMPRETCLDIECVYNPSAGKFQCPKDTWGIRASTYFPSFMQCKNNDVGIYEQIDEDGTFLCWQVALCAADCKQGSDFKWYCTDLGASPKPDTKYPNSQPAKFKCVDVDFTCPKKGS